MARMLTSPPLLRAPPSPPFPMTACREESRVRMRVCGSRPFLHHPSESLYSGTRVSATRGCAPLTKRERKTHSLSSTAL